MRRALLPLAALSIAIQPAALAAQDTTDPDILESERRIKRAEAEAAEHEADKLKYEKQKAAAEAKFGFLPKSPAEGKTEVETGGGALESEFLVSEALASAARLIADDVTKLSPSEGSVLIVEGAENQGTASLVAFQVESFGLKMASARALRRSNDLCQEQPVGITSGAFGAGALFSALSDMLKSDVKVSGNETKLTAAQLVRAIIAKEPKLFRTGFFDSAGVNENNAVVKELDCLSRYRDEIANTLAEFDTDEEKKANAAQISRLTAQLAANDALLDRLVKFEKDSPPQLASLYADAENFDKAAYVLRVWVDKGGGTTITRKNLWTTLGARSIGMTGGAVVSYLLIDKSDGSVRKAGFLKCSTELVSLRRAHQLGNTQRECIKLVEPS